MPLPVGAANGGNSVSAGLAKGDNVLRLNTSDGNDWNAYGARDLFDKRHVRLGATGMRRGLEHVSRHAPGGAGRLRCNGFVDAVNADSSGDVGSDFPGFGNSQ